MCEVSLHVALEGVTKMFYQGRIKITQQVEEKYTFDVVMDGLRDISIEDVREGAAKDAFNNIRKDAQEATITFESKQNVVNILHFHLPLIIFVIYINM